MASSEPAGGTTRAVRAFTLEGTLGWHSEILGLPVPAAPQSS